MASNNIKCFVAIAMLLVTQNALGIVKPISSCQDLQNIEQDTNSNYKLINDIDCSNFEFKPIPEFSGVLDGEDATIYDLNINTNKGAALFSTAKNATIRNVNILDANIKGGKYTGTLIGKASGVTLENIKIKTQVNSASYSGGMAGTIGPSYLENSEIDRPSKLININVDVELQSVSNSSHTGGLAGTMEGSDLTICNVAGSMNTNSKDGYHGGVVGYLAVAEIGYSSDIRNALITGCVSEIDVNSTAEKSRYQSTLVGRVIGGEQHSAIIRNSIATGDVITPNFRGPLQIGNRIGKTIVQ